MLLLLRTEWRLFVFCLLVTALIPLWLQQRVQAIAEERHTMGVSRLLSSKPSASSQQKDLSSNAHIDTYMPDKKFKWTKILQAAKDAEREVLNFFHGEPRALQDGVPFGATEDTSKFLTQRLADRISYCDRNNAKQSSCKLKVVFVGSAQSSGRDNFYNESFPFMAERRLQQVAHSTGLELQVLNHAMDSDLSREGPQTTHMCLANLVGSEVDVIVWDLDGNMQAKPSAQVEAFLRWAWALQPAMIMINRGGPHGLSRRGKQRTVVNLGPGHDAFVFEDDPNNMPEQRTEQYRKSSKEWQQQWEKGRNEFWLKLFDKYKPFLDIAAIDPKGSIWHLDHLLEFSNQAFDANKVLPLVDCAKPHPPPCNQIPDFIERRLANHNLTKAHIPTENVGGAVCSSLLGCRHVWYGGKRSHMLRGELNALPIIRAIHNAAEILASQKMNMGSIKGATTTNTALSSISATLPQPEYCSNVFCSFSPTCHTSYVPNLGLDLANDIMKEKTSPASMPRKGASHFGDDPDYQIQNLNVRFSPLGYIDRKFAYRLSNADAKSSKKKIKPEEVDAFTTAIQFQNTNDEGPLVLCEPPCFIDSCSKNRMMPMIDYVELELDGKKIESLQHVPAAVEVGGPFCKVIAGSVSKGSHVLRLSTNVTTPQHVMFSHLISFS